MYFEVQHLNIKDIMRKAHNFLRYKHFNKDKRNELAILLKKGYSRREIARVLGRSPSSVSREVKRNSVNGRYEPGKADHKARVKRRRSKHQGMKIRANRFLENYIHEKIKLSWSPERIAGRLHLETGISITFKSIYKYIHHNPFGSRLRIYLKYQGKPKRDEKNSQWGETIKNRVFIDQRPEIVNQKLRYGDFEADTMGRSKEASSQTLVVARERKSRFILAKKVSRLKFAMEGLKEIFSPLPVKSLTLDNGRENARYAELGIKSYFCHPYASWQKGSVENGIGLIRAYIPKKSDLINYSEGRISAIIDRINSIPMKCLKYRTPKEVFYGRYLSKFNKEQCCT